MFSEILPPEIVEALGPDDSISRSYLSPDRKRQANLFIVYYRTQHRAKNAHDPKICLPGSGWNVRDSSVITIPTSPQFQSAQVNKYVIAKGDTESVVLYWYQTHKRAIAEGHHLRLFRVIDTVVDHRSDMALVRFVIPVVDGRRDQATELGKELIQASYPHILTYFPATPP